jgi:phage virion morphogenesis protein
MTNLRVEFTIAEAVDLIEGLENRLTDLTPAMKGVGEYMLLKTRERFDDEVDPSGQKWKTLADSTVESKRRRKTKSGKRARVRAAPTDILKESRLLRDTIAYDADSTSVRVGTPQEYGKFHQSGTTRMPQREFLGVDAEDLTEIDEIVVDYLRL